MIAGHAPLAVAIAALFAWRFGVDERDAIILGLLAGAFAVVPDVDMTYAAVGLLGSDASGVWSATEAFWSHSKIAHRAITHSLVLGAPAAVAFGLVCGRGSHRVGGIAILAALVAIGWVAGGPLGAIMTSLFAVSGLVVASGAVRLGVGVRPAIGAAVVGLLTHPFGDVFTGTPPRFLYPIDVAVLTDRVPLHPDPTLNLLSIFGLELVCIWLGVFVVSHLHGWSIRRNLDWRAAAGAGYGAAALVLPAPTLDVSYHFVFSVLAVGSVGAAPLSGEPYRLRFARSAITGLAAVTLGFLAFAAVYSLV